MVKVDKFLNLDRVMRVFTLAWKTYGPYKRRIVLLTLLGLVSSFLEGIGITALIPLFSFAFGDGNGGNDFLSRQIAKVFGLLGIDFSVTYLLIFIGLLFILRAFLGVTLNFIRARITSEYEEQLRNRLFNGILMADWPHLMKQKSGYLETILLYDVPASSGMLNQFAIVLATLGGLAVYMFVAFNVSLSISLSALVLGGVFMFLIKPLFSRIKQLARERTITAKEATHHVSENISGIKTVKTLFVQAGVAEKGRRYFRSLKELNVRAAFLKGLGGAFVLPLGVIFILFIFAFLYKSPNFNLAALAVIIYLVERIFTYFQGLQSSLHTANDSVPHVLSVLNYEVEFSSHREIESSGKPFVFERALEFRNVDFAYDGGKTVLSKINFVLKKGEMVGLIGPSGVGKTTLVDLILRLLTPSQGQILLDGQEIAKIGQREWYRNIGYVSQDIFLMNDTIASNIKFYDDAISNEAMIEAAKQANIYDFIIGRPEGFETIIGERGVMLSAGQRQRIVIARILARHPQLLILDEATSALDNESEIRIQESIQKLKGKITILVIAHRLSTILNTDRLISLEKGIIVEQGEPKQLLSDKDSYFFKVYHLREI